MKKIAFISGALILTPFVASAQDLSFFTTMIAGLDAAITAAVPVVIGLAILLFLWGLARYMLNQDDAEARAGARSIMLWGIVIIFVMVALWGLVNLLETFTGVGTGTARPAPTLP